MPVQMLPGLFNSTGALSRLYYVSHLSNVSSNISRKLVWQKEYSHYRKIVAKQSVSCCCHAPRSFSSDPSQTNKDRSKIIDIVSNSRQDVFGDVAQTLGKLKHDGKNYDSVKLSWDSTEGSDTFIRRSRYNRKKLPAWYGKQIQKLGKEGKIKEAIEVFEKQMIEKDRVRPDVYTYTTLIAVLGRVGYTRKAFSLFNEMKKTGLKPSDHIYTSLFNSCALSPWNADGLSRAKHLRVLMIQQGIIPNLTHYKAMMRAFVVCGDPATAFLLIDEMSERRLRLDTNAYCFLLMACVGDKEAGYSLLIQLWRLMRKRQIAPDIYSYNLLLQSIKECSLGNSSTLNSLLSAPQQNSTHSPSLVSSETDDHEDDSSSSSSSSDSDEESEMNKSPSAYSSKVGPSSASSDISSSNVIQSSPPIEPSSGTVVSNQASDVFKGLPTIDTSSVDILDPSWSLPHGARLPVALKQSDRLSLLGGVTGVLARMKRDRVKPNVKTLTSLVEMADGDLQKEFAHIMSRADELGVEVDTDFFNAMVRQYKRKKMIAEARDVLSSMSARGLYPNVRTFACLAINTSKQKEGLGLLQNMQDLSVTPEPVVFNTLLKHSGLDLEYAQTLLKEMTVNGVHPNAETLRQIMLLKKYTRLYIIKQEQMHKQKHKQPAKTSLDAVGIKYEQFTAFCNEWLKNQPALTDGKPWKEFETERGSEKKNLAS